MKKVFLLLLIVFLSASWGNEEINTQPNETVFLLEMDASKISLALDPYPASPMCSDGIFTIYEWDGTYYAYDHVSEINRYVGSWRNAYDFCQLMNDHEDFPPEG